MSRTILCGLLLATTSACAEPVNVDLLVHFEEWSNVLPDLPCTVMRMDLDVTGDGTAELLLAQSQTAGSSGVQEWFVYASLGGGRYKPLGELGFSYLLFRVTQGPTRLLAYHATGRGSGDMVAFRIDLTGVQEESRHGGVASGGVDWPLFEAWREQVALKVLSSNLTDLESGTPQWTDLLSREVVPGVGGLSGVVVVVE